MCGMFSFALSGSFYHKTCHGIFSKNVVFTIDGVNHMCGVVSRMSNAVINGFGAFLIVAAGHKAKNILLFCASFSMVESAM